LAALPVRVMAWTYVDPFAGSFNAPVFITGTDGGDVVVNDGRTRRLASENGSVRWSVDSGFVGAAITSYGAVAGAYAVGSCLGAQLRDSAEGSPVWSFVDPTVCSEAYPQAAAVDSIDNVVVGGLRIPLVGARRIHVMKVNGATGTLVWRTNWIDSV